MSLQPCKTFGELLGIIWLSSLLLFVNEQVKADVIFNKSENGDSDTISSGTNEFDSLAKASISLLYQNPDSARSIAMSTLNNLPEDNITTRMRLLNLIGATYHLQSNYALALDYYYKALNMSLSQHDTTRMADTYNNIGNLYFKTGNYKDALSYLLKAVKLYHELDQQRNLASALNNMGLLYLEIGNFQKAKEHFKEAYIGFNLQHDSIGASAALGNIGLGFSNDAIYDSALYYYNRVIAMAKSNYNNYGLCINYQGKANVFFNMGLYDDAIEYYKKSHEIALFIRHPYQEAFSDLGLARIFIVKSKLDSAACYANDALDIALNIENPVLEYECHEVLSMMYEKKGDLLKSLEQFKLFTEQKEKLVNQTTLHQIYNIEINQLTEVNAVKELEIEQQELTLKNKTTLLWLIIVGFLLSFAWIYLLYLNYRHRQNAKLQKTILRLTEKKSRAAIEAELQERKRIGSELHDGLGQMLSVARLNISVLQQKSRLTEDRKKELLDTAILSVDKAFNELRDISHNLAPSVLTEKGFVSALKDLTDQVNKSKLMRVSLETFGMNGPMDPLIENTLYRAAQELLTNAIKHSEANQVSLQVVKSDTEITFMVEDNGKGLSVDKTNITGSGLSNIRSRVENLNGNVFIDAMENRGTIVTIVIQFKKSDHVEK